MNLAETGNGGHVEKGTPENPLSAEAWRGLNREIRMCRSFLKDYTPAKDFPAKIAEIRKLEERREVMYEAVREEADQLMQYVNWLLPQVEKLVQQIEEKRGSIDNETPVDELEKIGSELEVLELREQEVVAEIGEVLEALSPGLALVRGIPAQKRDKWYKTDTVH